MPTNGAVVTTDRGEVVSSEAAESVISLLSPTEVVAYTPYSPAEVEELIVNLSQRIEHAPVVITMLYEEVHRAEEAYQLTFSEMMLASPNPQATFARAYANKMSAEKLHTVNLAKEKLRYAEWLQTALQSRLYGLLNINKSITASMFGQQAGRGA